MSPTVAPTGIPGVDPSTIPGDPFPTSSVAAQANVLAASKIIIANLNADLKNRYLSAFNDWCISVNAGRIDNSNPPVPPYAWELAPPNADGYVFYQISTTTKVCDMPPVPQSHINVPEPPVGTFELGAYLGGGWYAAGQNDRVASGTVKVMPPGMLPDFPNGVKLQKVGFFMGNGWYEVIQ